jgi:hypothetical protein
MEMEENAGLNQVFEEREPLSQAELLRIVCNALKIATGGEPERLDHLLEKLEKIIQLNIERPQMHLPLEEGECSMEQRDQQTG